MRVSADIHKWQAPNISRADSEFACSILASCNPPELKLLLTCTPWVDVQPRGSPEGGRHHLRLSILCQNGELNQLIEGGKTRPKHMRMVVHVRDTDKVETSKIV